MAIFIAGALGTQNEDPFTYNPTITECHLDSYTIIFSPPTLNYNKHYTPEMNKNTHCTPEIQNVIQCTPEINYIIHCTPENHYNKNYVP